MTNIKDTITVMASEVFEHHHNRYNISDSNGNNDDYDDRDKYTENNS